MLPASVSYRKRRCISHTPGGRFFQARSLDNQEGANTETIRLREALGAVFSNADLFGTDTTPTVEIIDHGKSAQGGLVLYTPSYTVLRRQFIPGTSLASAVMRLLAAGGG